MTQFAPFRLVSGPWHPALPALADLQRQLAAEREDRAHAELENRDLHRALDEMRADLAFVRLERDRALKDADRWRRAAIAKLFQWGWPATLCCTAGGFAAVVAIRLAGL